MGKNGRFGEYRKARGNSVFKGLDDEEVLHFQCLEVAAAPHFAVLSNRAGPIPNAIPLQRPPTPSSKPNRTKERLVYPKISGTDINILTDCISVDLRILNS